MFSTRVIAMTSSVILIGVLTTGCIRSERQQWALYYSDLLAQFPEDHQGEGPEPSGQVGIVHQPKTYALIVSAETLRLLAFPNDESRRRIRKAVRWLLDNADLDNDGIPGWGFPYAWDAFGDGTLTPAYTPYTIDTAFVLLGLLDALKIQSFWADAERWEILNVIREVCVQWSEDTWSDTARGGFFWYSRSAFDAHFVTNVSAMFAAALLRAITEQKDVFLDPEHQLVQTHVDKAIEAIVSQVIWHNDAPFWNYIPVPNSFNQDKLNDLLHHIYILWSAELYRLSGQHIMLPWSLGQALDSLNRFWREGEIYDFPQDVTYEGEQESFNDRPASIRGLGMLLAFYSRWRSPQKARETLKVIDQDYGPLPTLRLRPDIPLTQNTFYPRFAVHTFWGLALLAFGER
jgi:hypothetical protein